MSDRVTTALEVQNIVGEFLGWNDLSDALLWVDILGCATHDTARHPVTTKARKLYGGRAS